MQSKYEEKTFESYFNTELDRRTEIYFPFGQVQEGGIGADAAAASNDRWLWRKLGFPYLLKPKFSGVDLRVIADAMEHHINNEIRNIPSIKTNLLFQYKRPEVITSANGAEWSHWNQRYFRYPIYAEQQELLEHLDKKFGSKALVLYASPALVDISDLVKAKLDGNIIEATNFCPVSKLHGHHRNTYVRAGLHSMAFSEPERLPSFELLKTLKQLEPQKSGSNIKLVLRFASSVRNSAEDDPYIGGSYRALLQPYQERGLEKHKSLFAHITMSVLRDLTGIQWLIPVASK